MKRLLSFFIIFLMGFVFVTMGKNYLIYQHVVTHSQSSHQIHWEHLTWGWDGVSAQKGRFQKSPEKDGLDGSYTIDRMMISHEWLKPREFQVYLHDIKSHSFHIENAACGVAYGDTSITSDNLIIKKTKITLNRQGSSENHTLDILIPHIHSTFQYQRKPHELTLTLGVPSFENTGLFGVSLRGNGKLLIHGPLNGQIDLHVRGISKIVTTLIAGEIIKKKKAHLFSLGAKLLGGQEDASDIPLVFDQGSIYLGPFLIHKGKGVKEGR